MLHTAASEAGTIRTSRIIERVPFFYGWVVLAACTFGQIMTSPGQTYAISIFIEHFIADLGISRSVVSSFYAVGTLLGSFALPFVGRQVDRRSPRLMVGIIAGLFGVACIYMSFVQAGWMLLIGFVAVRMLGQGSLGLVSTYVINQWWMRRRGMMNGIAGVATALLGVGMFPNLINWLIPQVGWRMTYVILGLALLCVMTPLGMLLYRERPERYGLRPDGGRAAKPVATAVAAGNAPAAAKDSQASHVTDTDHKEENWTPSEAVRTAAFWIIVLGMASLSMLSTGLTFHMVGIFADNALSTDAAAAVFVPIAFTSAIFNLASGILIDRMPVRFLLATALLLQVLALVMAQALTGVAVAILYGAVLGGLMGLQRTINTVALATYFGRLHLGSITGISSTVMVASSALGPLPMGLARDLLGEYNLALNLLALLPFALAVVSFFMRRPTKQAAAA